MLQDSIETLGNSSLPNGSDWKRFFTDIPGLGPGKVKTKLGRVGAIAGIATAVLAITESQALAQPTLGCPFVTGTNLNIPISGLIVGNSWLVITRDSVTPSAVQWWQPVDGTGIPPSPYSIGGPDYIWRVNVGFKADSTNGTWITPIPEGSSAFFKIISLDDYNACGSLPQINGIADGDVVNGTVTVDATMEDIFQPVYEDIYVDGNYYRGQAVSDGSSASLPLDTGSLSDGWHLLTVVFGREIPSQFPQHPPQTYEAWTGISIDVSNNPVLKSDRIRADGTNFVVDVSGMIPSGGDYIPGYGFTFPGHQYIIAQEEGITPQPFNNLTPMAVGTPDGATGQYVFAPTSTSESFRFPIPTNSSANFRVYDYTVFANTNNPPPSPVILSPADNSVVSGTIQINPTLTSPYPIDQAALYINQLYMGTITNGQPTLGWSVDTALFPNGSNNVVQVEYLQWVPEVDPASGDILPEPVYTSAVLTNLITANPLAENITPRGGFTAGLPNVAFAFDTADAAVVGVSVYDATGTNLVWNTTGTNTGPGTFTTYWDLKDNYGNPIPMPGVDQSTMYNVSVTTTPLEAGPLAIPMAKGAGSGSSRFFSFSINNDDPYAGHAAVFRNLWSLWVDIPLGVNSVEAGVAQGPIAAITTSYVMHSVDPDGYDRSMNSTASPFVFKADEDMPYFYNVITNQATGHIIYICDASPYEFGSSVGYTCMSGSFGFVDVARTLGNPINSVRPLAFEWGHRVRYAEIDGCKSAVLSAAGCSFGSPASLDHYQMTKSAYVGWRTMRWSSVYWWPFNSASDYQIKYLHDYWTDMGQDTGIPLRTAGNECFDDVGANVYWKNSWTVQGSPGLTWWKKD